MRTLIAIAVFSIGLSQFPVLASEVEFQLDFADAANVKTDAPASATEQGPFNSTWDVKGIEKRIDVYSGYTGRQRPKESSVPPVDRQKLFEAVWFSRSTTERTSYYRCRSECSPSSTLPHFDSGWLLDALWPRTRSYFDGRDTDVMSFAAQNCVF